MHPQHQIRLANREDTDTVCRILASAFANDPVMTWLSGHPEIYATLFRLEALSLYNEHNHVFINAAKSGAAMWLPAGISHHAPMHWSLGSAIWGLFKTGGLKSLRRGLSLERLFEQYTLDEPHFYLHAIGAEQGKQGQGIGSLLLKAGLQLCDAQGLPAYLESSNQLNNPLYQRFGFRVINEIVLPDNGPTVWTMLREARPKP
jgi:GNAT superfamily N-acetyltransferase